MKINPRHHFNVIVVDIFGQILQTTCVVRVHRVRLVRTCTKHIFFDIVAALHKLRPITLQQPAPTDTYNNRYNRKHVLLLLSVVTFEGRSSRYTANKKQEETVDKSI